MLWRRNASLAGGFAGRPVLVMCFVVCYDLPFAGISQVSCLPLFHCLCRYQDRATEHLRPNPRKKKDLMSTVSIVTSWMSLACSWTHVDSLDDVCNSFHSWHGFAVQLVDSFHCSVFGMSCNLMHLI